YNLTLVDAGTLLLEKTGGALAIPNRLTIGDGGGGANADVVRLGADEQIADSAIVEMAGSGLLDLSDNSETIGSLSGSGNINLGSGTLTLASGFRTNNYAGAITGSGGVTKLGSSSQSFSGVNSYTGPTSLQNGLL